MKGIVYSNYGSPDVLKCEEIEKPTAWDDEVLIEVRAASVNPLDWRLMRGRPYIVRIQAGLDVALKALEQGEQLIAKAVVVEAGIGLMDVARLRDGLIK